MFPAAKKSITVVVGDREGWAQTLSTGRHTDLRHFVPVFAQPAGFSKKQVLS